MENTAHMTDLTALSYEELRAYVHAAHARQDEVAFMAGVNEATRRSVEGQSAN